MEILEALPEWFEIPESREMYAKNCREIPLWVDNGRKCCKRVYCYETNQ